ncbi:MAG: hypothetical protein V7L29_12680 [Nostoc sp.]|uniref:hypothetical protein n=1 Tax=Nostoc sp. TaxID=1180 RepID=UPI002FF384A4
MDESSSKVDEPSFLTPAQFPILPNTVRLRNFLIEAGCSWAVQEEKQGERRITEQ